MGYEVSRRELLRKAGLGAGALGAGSLLAACGGGGGGGGGPLGGGDGGGPKHAASGDIEKGAKLQLLRWSQFIDADKKQWQKNTKAFTEKTGVPVTIEWEDWTNIAAKAATAARVGSGPDIAIAFYDTPQRFPSKVIDLSDVAKEIGGAAGGWFDAPQKYGMYEGKWIGIPLGANGAEWNYRKSMVKKAGFDEFPKDTDSLLELAKALHKDGNPMGLALGHAVGDANTWCHWLLWAFGGKTVDDNDKVVVNSPETVKALTYVNKLYEYFIPGTASWLDNNNNKAYLSGKLGATINGISIYFAAREDAPKIGDDTMTAHMPVGPVGKPTQFHQISQAMVFAYTKYPNAAREYLKFMWSKDQYLPWMKASIGYTSPPLADYAEDPFWQTNPRYKAYQYAAKNMLWDGYSGDLGGHSSQALADYVVVDMISRAATGQQSPKDAASSAESRLKRIYG
ncbi:MAG: ABC transporter substrate-binding protein [Nocardioidaceae bacterium]